MPVATEYCPVVPSVSPVECILPLPHVELARWKPRSLRQRDDKHDDSTIVPQRPPNKEEDNRSGSESPICS